MQYYGWSFRENYAIETEVEGGWKEKYDQFLRKKLEEYGTNAGDQNVDEMLTCLKNAVKETRKDFNSAWDVDVDKMYLPIDLRDPMNEE